MHEKNFPTHMHLLSELLHNSPVDINIMQVRVEIITDLERTEKSSSVFVYRTRSGTRSALAVNKQIQVT